MEDKYVYHVEDLDFAYGKHKVLDKISFTIAPGRITTLIGANGCGKSTLFYLLTKNLRPDGGALMFRGRELASIKLREFAKEAAIVHQYNVAPADISVEKLVGYGCSPYHSMGRTKDPDLDEEKIRWAMETTNVLKYRDRPMGELSGGQKQRVWLAMALAQDTKILFLDEPTTYLDIRYQLQILKLTRRLNREFGITVIMVLHDLNQALYYSDEILAMKDGKITAQGAPGEVVTEQVLKEVYEVDLRLGEVEGKPFLLPV